MTRTAVVVLYGVSGAGKTVVGRLLAGELGWTFYDADDFHSRQNVERMREGIALTDADRWPWLDRIRELIEDALRTESSAVVACSALKTAYRNHLRVDEAVKLVHLRVDPATVAARLRARRDHFMNPGLLESQFAALDPPGSETAIVVDADMPPEAIVRNIRASLAV
jgi:gluconokinase